MHLDRPIAGCDTQHEPSAGQAVYGGCSLDAPADCLSYPLLQDSARTDWRLWLKALGTEDDFLLVRAAVAGQGIALVRDIYAREEIAEGRLAVALNQPWPSEFAYYVVTLPAATERPAIAHFVDWLAKEAQAR